MAEQLCHYLSTIYKQGESYELVTESRTNDKGKTYPFRSKQNIHTFDTESITDLETLIQNTPDGAWITSNPLRTEIQGNATSDKDITDYRFVLVESDEVSREEQWKQLNELRLPIATVVWSGGKSLHALVHIDAGTDRKLYDDRVRKLYKYLEDKQFKVDAANKNPSRLTRVPGFYRENDMQYLVAENIGPKCWLEFENTVLVPMYAKTTPAAPVMNYDELEEDLIAQYGEPLVFNNDKLAGINQMFFAAYTIEKCKLKIDPEKKLRKYDSSTGLWKEIRNNMLPNLVAQQLRSYAITHQIPMLTSKISASCCKEVVTFINGSEFDNSGFHKTGHNVIHTANGMLVFDEAGNVELKPFAPEYHSRNRTEIKYDPSAQCPMFLNNLLGKAMCAEDMEVLQMYSGQCLLGYNPAQMILLLTGTANGGKSTAVNVIEGIIGEENHVELRVNKLDERFEQARFIGKTLLTARDVNSDFLNNRGAHKLKALVGKDTLTPEIKGSNETIDIEGTFNVIITANSDLTVSIDTDVAAWRRRLLWIRYDRPAIPDSERIDDLYEQLMQKEGSGILNWMIEGAKKLKQNGNKIPRTPEHLARIDALLMESSSVDAFVENCLEEDEGTQVMSDVLLTEYLKYCGEMDWEPLPERVIRCKMKSAIQAKFRITQRRDLVNQYGHYNKGYVGIRLSNYDKKAQKAVIDKHPLGF